MDKDRLDRQIEFIREIDKEKSIGRQTYLADASRKEDDAEHAWHMAIMTVLLSEYANEKIDVLRTMTMLLIHDLVEIDAGDTYAYDENAKKTYITERFIPWKGSTRSPENIQGKESDHLRGRRLDETVWFPSEGGRLFKGSRDGSKTFRGH